VQAMFNELDKDRRGSIDLAELILFVTKTRKQAGKTKERWGAELAECHRYLHKAALSIGGAAELFKVLDKNKDGRLEVLELQGAIRKLFGIGSEELPDKAIKALFTYLDKDGSGSVDVAELVLFVSGASKGMSEDEASAKIAAGLKGAHTRKQLKDGNASQFEDPERTNKVLHKRARTSTNVELASRSAVSIPMHWVNPVTGLFTSPSKIGKSPLPPVASPATLSFGAPRSLVTDPVLRGLSPPQKSGVIPMLARTSPTPGEKAAPVGATKKTNASWNPWSGILD